jgi:hypothetical protein
MVPADTKADDHELTDPANASARQSEKAVAVGHGPPGSQGRLTSEPPEGSSEGQRHLQFPV